MHNSFIYNGLYLPTKSGMKPECHADSVEAALQSYFPDWDSSPRKAHLRMTNFLITGYSKLEIWK